MLLLRDQHRTLRQLMRPTRGHTRDERLRDARSFRPRQLRWFAKNLGFRHGDKLCIRALQQPGRSVSANFGSLRRYSSYADLPRTRDLALRRLSATLVMC